VKLSAQRLLVGGVANLGGEGTLRCIVSAHVFFMLETAKNE